jgi:hypothetical protein
MIPSRLCLVFENTDLKLELFFDFPDALAPYIHDWIRLISAALQYAKTLSGAGGTASHRSGGPSAQVAGQAITDAARLDRSPS